MPRHKKDYEILNIKLLTSISDDLNTYVEKTGLTKTAAVERILSQYLADWKEKSENSKSEIL